MKRWDFTQMLSIGRKLFAKLQKRKRLVHHNHDIHFLAREIETWLPNGITSLIEGSYTPEHAKRLYFKDEVVEQFRISDRILQHILLKQLKTTFSKVVNPNCLHIHGPYGVKLATDRIRQILKELKPNFVIRADIKSFYRSIPHYKLLQDIKKTYDDPKVCEMLARVITNPIETPRGYQNPHQGIALRGPLSQFISALYLKPLDDAFNAMKVTYLRYQDDILILCQTKRQFNRCKRKMMEILQERRLTLSRKKSRMGCIKSGFHFLGVNYPGTRLSDNTNTAHFTDVEKNDICSLFSHWGANRLFNIKKMKPYAFILMQGHCVRLVSMLNRWYLVGFLSKKSAVTCIIGRYGGQKHRVGNITRS